MLPTEAQIAQSEVLKCDRFYKVPKIVECFIQRFNREAKPGYEARAWTINRTVTIYYLGSAKAFIDYDTIEDNIVFILDLVLREL